MVFLLKKPCEQNSLRIVLRVFQAKTAKLFFTDYFLVNGSMIFMKYFMLIFLVQKDYLGFENIVENF